MTTAIGAPLHRVDGRPKVTGKARYPADVPMPDMAYAHLVGSRIANGRITGIDTAEAEAETGVLAVLTHRNLPKIATQPPLVPSLAGGPAPGETFFPMQDEVVHYGGQHIAIVVADTYERAEHAASLVRVTYEESPPVTTIEQGRDQAYEPDAIFAGFIPGSARHGATSRTGLAEADVQVDGDVHLRGRTTTTRSSPRRRRRAGTATNSSSTTPPRASTPPSSPSPRCWDFRCRRSASRASSWAAASAARP